MEGERTARRKERDEAVARAETLEASLAKAQESEKAASAERKKAEEESEREKVRLCVSVSRGCGVGGVFVCGCWCMCGCIAGSCNNGCGHIAAITIFFSFGQRVACVLTGMSGRCCKRRVSSDVPYGVGLFAGKHTVRR